MRGSTAGFSGTLSFSHSDTPLLLCADVLLSCVVLTPASVVYWCSTWFLLDQHVYPDEPVYSAVVCAVFGQLSSLVLCLCQTWLRDNVRPDTGRWRYYVLSRLYSGVAGVTCIAAMRGVWNLMDELSGVELPSLLWSTSVCVLALVSMRILKIICAIPFVVVMDTPQDHFDVPTFFKKGPEENHMYLLDCLFSVSVCSTISVGVWRGLWAIADALVYPDDPLLSLLASLVLGYGLVLATFALQEPASWLALKLGGSARLLFADIYKLISFVATILVWRGIWGLVQGYVFPDYPEIRNWSCHVVSMVILISMNCFNTVLVRGIYFDDEELAEEAVSFPCHYIRLHYHKRRMRQKFRQAATSEKNVLEDSNVPLQSTHKV